MQNLVGVDHRERYAAQLEISPCCNSLVYYITLFDLYVVEWINKQDIIILKIKSYTLYTVYFWGWNLRPDL